MSYGYCTSSACKQFTDMQIQTRGMQYWETRLKGTNGAENNSKEQQMRPGRRLN